MLDRILIAVFAGALGAYASYTFEYWHERDWRDAGSAWAEGVGYAGEKQEAEKAKDINQEKERLYQETRRLLHHNPWASPSARKPAKPYSE